MDDEDKDMIMKIKGESNSKPLAIDMRAQRPQEIQESEEEDNTSVLNFDHQLKTQEALPLRTPTPPSVTDGNKPKVNQHLQSESSDTAPLPRRASRNRTLANIHEEDMSMIIEVQKDKLTSNVPLPSSKRGKRHSDSESDEDYSSDRKKSLTRNRKRSLSQSSRDGCESDVENKRGSGKRTAAAASRKGKRANNQTIAEDSAEEDSDQFGVVDLEPHKKGHSNSKKREYANEYDRVCASL